MYFGSYLSDLICKDTCVRFLASLSTENKFDCYFVNVSVWRTFVDLYGIPGPCLGAVVVLVTCALDHRDLDSVFDLSDSFICGSFSSPLGGDITCDYKFSQCRVCYDNSCCGDVPVMISLSLSSRVLFRRSGYDLDLVLPDRPGCLHDLMISNVRSFIGVF